MHLDTLKVENFRCFKNFEINFDEQLTVLVAPNGSGKTATLDAIAVALGPFVGRSEKGRGKQFSSKDSRRVLVSVNGKGTYIPSPFMPITIHASGRLGGRVETWKRQKRTEKGGKGRHDIAREYGAFELRLKSIRTTQESRRGP